MAVIIVTHLNQQKKMNLYQKEGRIEKDDQTSRKNSESLCKNSQYTHSSSTGGVCIAVPLKSAKININYKY